MPGHTSDAIVLIDQEPGLLSTGDTFYAGRSGYTRQRPTDLVAYEQSIDHL
ncbi:MAG: hypothetical protein JKX81_07895, partial [Arenicella sp.]|nr:hypothetical protein [Arenicella sp.]